ncbi:pyridoxamine 5'-phosphate oxidase family protein [Bosea sp. 2KB_26]|uniref:pyridoxamine 5'-phosphate oxidase family protein n=1 Tax=Bosea sp. 2KB_26 TaxID=3237475 RepID=UPI0013AFF56E
MVETPLQQRIWTALTDHTICMVSTIVRGRIRTRPMSGHVDREEHRILFVTHSHTGPVEELDASQTASIALSDENHNFYATIECRAERLDDPQLLKRIWSPLVGAWFPNGPDDPDVTLLALSPLSAEIWDGPSSAVVIAFKLATAKILGRAPDLGVNTTIDMR